MFTDNLYLRSNPVIYKRRADYQKKKFPTTFPITMSSLNAQYLAYLIKYPLLTKSITSGVFSGLNETVASVLTNEFQETKVAGIKIKHVFTQKLLTMIIYGSCIASN